VARGSRLWSGEWKRKRRLVLARDEGRCQLQLPGCTGLATCVDHVLPRKYGGTEALANLRAACRRCNQRRGDGTHTLEAGPSAW